MPFQKNSIVHNVALMYCAFTHLTDGEVADEEIKAVAGHSWGWLNALEVDLTGDDKVDVDDVKKLLFDDVIPYYNAMDDDSRIAEYVRVAHALHNLDWWNDECSTGFLADLKDIAEADGNFHKNEKGWINNTAEIFGVDSPA
jgi:hypothetical protein